MSRADGVLDLVVKRAPFLDLKSGQKPEEYRADQPSEFFEEGGNVRVVDHTTWSEKLFADHAWLDCEGRPLPRRRGVADRIAIESDRNTWHPYHAARISLGYHADRETFYRKIRCIRWGTPNPAWTYGIVSADKCFVIELGEILDDKARRCACYKDRPVACRDFERGSEQCMEARLGAK